MDTVAQAIVDGSEVYLYGVGRSRLSRKPELPFDDRTNLTVAPVSTLAAGPSA
jgi:hypothetical protein